MGRRVSRLGARLLVAAWGIPLIAGVILLGGWVFAVFCAAVCLLAQNEYYRMFKISGIPARIGLICGAAIPILIHLNPGWIMGWMALGAALITLTLISQDVDKAGMNFAGSVSGLLYPSFLLSFYVLIRDGDWGGRWNGALVILFIVTAIWICDTAAYFGGKHLGRRKLAPVISPNKTWEGAVFGLAGGLAWAFIAHSLIKPVLPLSACVIGGLIVGTVGQVGDLTESILKRSAGVKDSGTILGPHGGVLDRFDSLIAVGPIFYLYFIIAGLI